MRLPKGNYQGMDQYGQVFHLPNCSAVLKELKRKLGYTHSSPMYIDKPNGSTIQVGWVIGPHWVTILRVEPVEQTVSR